MNPPKILIVDDSEPLRRTIESMLRKVAGEFHECSNGHDAVAAYDLFRPESVGYANPDRIGCAPKRARARSLLSLSGTLQTI